ncbi:ATP-binding protein [Nibricoccus sp. IMCC34717]|uniref:ATP-binding protein n=1 Tax=Nibricoccus sp. IMCC34717 TaxID=3034021 RepID=UPI00384CB98E
MIATTGPIHRQVATFALVLCMAVILPMGAALGTYQMTLFRTRSAETFASTARVIAANSSASVAFADTAAANEILASLENVANIRAAGLYDNEGRKIASFRDVPASFAELPRSDGFEHLVVNVSYRGEKLGSLYVFSSLPEEFRLRLLIWTAVCAAGLLFAVILARVLSVRFRRIAADPIRALAKTASEVTEDRDYTLRAKAEGPTEVIALAKAFNEMLAEIERRDLEIASKNEALRTQLERLRAEVAERERAEQQLRETHREMVRLSREAGMAEVASGVLHNIGNVINSVNVSIELLQDRLHDNPRVAARVFFRLAHESNPKVDVVFAAHPEGAAFRKLLQDLSALGVAQFEGAAEEVQSLRNKLTHLKDVINRQQSLAKARIVTEPFDLRDAMRETLLLCEDSIAASRIQILETVEGPSQIIADRTYVIQILVNLVRNAATAIKGAAPAAPQIQVIYSGAGDRRRVLVRDNGIGISTDQLTRIFSYGFTTRNDGHGFGLHSAANAARMMGGSLSVESEGAGKGASFTLELPFYKLPQSHGHE